jgi:hypothetical protein
MDQPKQVSVTRIKDVLTEYANNTVSIDNVLVITIHNQYPGLVLTSPLYFSNGTMCYVSPSQQIGTNDTMHAIFGIDSKQKGSKCALLYKLQRSYINITENQSNSNIASIDDIALDIHLLVILDVKDDYHRFCACLIYSTNDFTWDEDKLWKLCDSCNKQLYWTYEYNVITWIVKNDIRIKTKCYITYGSDHNVDIIMPERALEHSTWKPVQIPKRWLVLLLLVLIVLIYVIRRHIQPSFKLNIHNQCLNINLISPTYVINDVLECHKPPAYIVYTEDTMKSSFTIKWYHKYYGALIYRIQKNQHNEFTEISEDTQSAVHLLVVWKFFEFRKIYVDVLLIEHDKRFKLDKDDLEELYRKNNNWFRWSPYSITETWSLDDNAALMITSEIMGEGQLLNVIISEVEGDNGTRAPVYIDLIR